MFWLAPFARSKIFRNVHHIGLCHVLPPQNCWLITPLINHIRPNVTAGIWISSGGKKRTVTVGSPRNKTKLEEKRRKVKNRNKDSINKETDEKRKNKNRIQITESGIPRMKADFLKINNSFSWNEIILRIESDIVGSIIKYIIFHDRGYLRRKVQKKSTGSCFFFY